MTRAAEQLNETIPRISGDTRLDELSVCTRSIFKSKADAVREGVILKSSDPSVVLLPDCFQPLLERVDALWTPTEDSLDDPMTCRLRGSSWPAIAK